MLSTQKDINKIAKWDIEVHVIRETFIQHKMT